MVQTRIFGKGIRVTIQPLGAPVPIVINSDAGLPDRDKSEQLFVSLSVDRKATEDLSSASITIMNLSPSTRQALLDSVNIPDVYSPKVGTIDSALRAEAAAIGVTFPERVSLGQGAAYVRVEAGYVGNLETIFEGSSRDIMTPPSNGPDILTVINAQDGANVKFGYAKRVINRLVIPYTEIFAYLADVMGLNFYPQLVPPSFNALFLRRSFVMNGYAREYARRLLDPHRLEHFIDSGELKILDRFGFIPLPPLVLTLENGLKNKPRRISSDNVEFNAFLIPGLTVGRRIELLDREVRGSWRLQEVAITGDNYQGELNVKCIAIPATTLVGG